MASPTAREVARDPRWLPHTFDMSGSTLTFAFVPRESRPELMFLSDEHFGGKFAKANFPVFEMEQASRDCAQTPLHFIFHTALCGSTLMLKALDIPNRAHGLKEPDVLINVANRFIRSDDASNRERLRLVLRLLARPFEPGEAILVKPSNIANRLALPALEARPEARAVLLYSDVRTLLRSIVKRGMWGRIWGRRIFYSAASWTSLDFGYSAEDEFVLSDLQALALGWLMQVHHFAEVRRQMGSRTLMIESGDFFGDPAATLLTVAKLFELDINEAQIRAVVSGSTFERHSKLAERSYGLTERTIDQSAAEAAHHEELEMVVKWVEAVAAHFGIDTNPAARQLANAV